MKHYKVYSENFIQNYIKTEGGLRTKSEWEIKTRPQLAKNELWGQFEILKQSDIPEYPEWVSIIDLRSRQESRYTKSSGHYYCYVVGVGELHYLEVKSNIWSTTITYNLIAKGIRQPKYTLEHYVMERIL